MEEAEKDILNSLSGHEKREQARKVKEEARQEKDVKQEAKEQRKQYFWIAFTLVLLVAFAVAIWYFYTHRQETYTDREVHWHALLDLSICGKKIDLDCPAETKGEVHGKNFCGEHILHHHFDNTAHIEGLVQKKEDIAIGKFFDAIEIPFDKDKIMDKKNGDLCEGKPGVLKMYVNDQPRTDFRDYVPFATQDGRKQIIKLVFEPEEGMIAAPTETPENITLANANQSS